MFEPGKLKNAIHKIKWLKLKILGCETKWIGSGRITDDEFVFCYSGNNDGYHRNGIGIILDSETNKATANFASLSDRNELIYKDTELTLTSYKHAPTAGKSEIELHN